MPDPVHSIMKPRTRPASAKIGIPATCILVGHFLSALSFPALSQTVNAHSGTARASVVIQPADPADLVVKDEVFALFDGLVRELRQGGYVMFMRHGSVLASSADVRKAGQWWLDCQSTQRLAPAAPVHARAIADAFRRQKIAVTELLTSEYCRAFDTGVHFGLVAPAKTAALNAFGTQANEPPAAALSAAVVDLLSRPTQARSNRMLVGHALPPSAVHPALAFLAEGHTAIFKPEGNQRFHYVTTLSPGQWQWIGKQVVADPTTPPPQVQQVVAQPAPNQILIAPDREIKGMQLIQALRNGGYNLYMRHAQSTIGQDGSLLQTPAWWENCAIQRNMSDTGREQARKVGSGIKALKIPVNLVVTAQFCRTRETGHLLGLGPIEVTEDMNHQIGQRAGFDVNAARFRRLAELPPKGTNNILVSHTHGSPRPEERIMGGIQEAEVVVYRPDGKGGSEPVARIPVPEWDNLVSLAAAARP